jgi:uncharacterized protein (UPF0248 family)
VDGNDSERIIRIMARGEGARSVEEEDLTSSQRKLRAIGGTAIPLHKSCHTCSGKDHP